MKSILTRRQFVNSYKLKKFSDYAIQKYNLKFPIFPNERLVKTVSFLTFDGHLADKMFLFTSGKMKNLYEPKNWIKEEFGLEGKFRKINSNNFGTSYEYKVISKPVSRLLRLIGTPLGNKVLTEFQVPLWVKKNKEFSKIYLRMAFDCEGSIWKEKDGRTKIRFKLNKVDYLLRDCLEFMKTLKLMLSKFDIQTTEVWVIDSNIRKDVKITKAIAFEVKANSLLKFKKEIGFNIIEKKKRLEGVN